MRVPFTFTRPGSGWVMNEQGIYVERGVDEPRHQWTPDGKSEGLLIERQATNLIAESANLDNDDYWDYSVSNRTVTRVFDPIADDVFELKATAGPPAGIFTFGKNVQIVGEVERTVSILAKAGTHRYLKVGNRSFEHRTMAVFDLQNGSVTTSSDVSDAAAVDRGRGWYLLHFQTSSSGSQRGFYLTLTDSDGTQFEPDGTETVYIAYPQITEGPALQAPIPTSGTPVTRPADSLYADMSLVEGFDPTRGTIVLGARVFDRVGGILSMWQTFQNQQNVVNLTRASNGNPRIQFSAQGETQLRAVSIDDASVFQVAIRYTPRNMAISANGGEVLGTVDTGNDIQGLRYLRVLNNAQALARFVRYYPHAVSDAELQQLSSLP